MEDMDSSSRAAPRKTGGILVAATCFAASLGFVSLGGGALVGVLLLISEIPGMPRIEGGERAEFFVARMEFFVMVLYGVAFGCFVAAAALLFVGIRAILRA